MIGVVDVKVNAANPNFPLDPVFTFKDSPQSFRVRNVPRKIGAWAISQVFVNVAYPDNSTIVQECLLIGGVWVGTVGGCSTTGSVKHGFVVTANGTDENGNSVNGYVLGVGDIFVKDFDGTITPGTSAARMFFYESVPATPKEGDACFQNGVFTVWDGSSWQASDVPHDDQKLDGAATYPAWTEPDTEGQYHEGVIVSYKGRLWQVVSGVPETTDPPGYDSGTWTEVYLKDLKQDALLSAQLAAVNSGATAEKVATWDGYAAQIAAKANTSDVNAALAQKASLTDLPYRLVEPGKWEFSGLPEEATVISEPTFQEGSESTYFWVMEINVGGDPVQLFSEIWNDPSHENDLSVTMSNSGAAVTVTATRASLPGHLLDRAGNRVVVSGDTTLTLPAAVPGYLRDFLVRLEISGSTVPTITFAAPTGETITYETDGDAFPVPDEAGDWLYSFTENCVAHTFAVSLKKVNEVAAPQAQGGA